MSHLIRRPSGVRLGTVVRATLAVLIAGGVAVAVSYASARQRSARATARLNSAAVRLDSLTDAAPADDRRRVAIAWGYAERMHLGLESPFRLIEAADRDPRLTVDERRTVAWALLAHVLRGETHDIDPAALDELGPAESGRIASGDQHLALIREAIVGAEDPRAAELAIRLAYTLASAERLIDGSAPFLVAEAAAMIADGEIARREAAALLRSSRGEDLIAIVRGRRARKAFYVERPTLLAPGEDVERAAIVMARPLLDTIRLMRPVVAPDSAPIPDLDAAAAALAPRLYAAGVRVPPSAPLAVTVQRYLPMMRSHAPRIDHDALARARNAEMLVAVTRVRDAGRPQRRVIGRLLLAAGVAMRSLAQEPVWFATDTVPSATQLATSLGLRGIVFDHDVPRAWRPYYLRSLADGIGDLRRVLPALRLDAVQVRFRMTAPADSALAMHDPRTRTLHLPILSAGGTLSHELAHDLDRQSALQEGYSGYRSDIVARSAAPQKVVGSANGRLAASLLALTEELSAAPQASRAVAERPAEIFATRVDWFVASALARQGISSGFLSAVQDELLTGHVVHPERLRTSSRTRSLLTALEGMTAVAPFAAQDQEPSVQTLLRWSLGGPVDRRGAAEILRGEHRAWALAPLTAGRSCDEGLSGRVALVRMAAESRARGWMRVRARWTADGERGAWARATLRQSPWSDADAERRVAALRDYVLVGLASSEVLPAGLSAYAAPLAMRARCTS